MVREDHFVITVASEIMAILCLADNLADLKRRLGKIIVAYTFDGKPVTADDLQATGAMAALLKDVDQAEYDPDSGAYTGSCTRRTICKYCAWMQQCTGNKNGVEDERYHHHRGRIRCGSGC